MRLALIALALTGCTVQSLAWRVDCESTTVAQLDARYRQEVSDVYGSQGCEVGDPLPGGGYVSSVTECVQYHRVWRRYWAARRDLESCR